MQRAHAGLLASEASLETSATPPWLTAGCSAAAVAAVQVPLGSLPAARVGLLVDAARSFALRWMDACRRRRPITKHVYGVAAGGW